MDDLINKITIGILATTGNDAYSCGMRNGMKWCKSLLDGEEPDFEEVPSVQPEIIRCKDCRWQKDQSGSTAWLPCREIVTPSDFYCGRAERRSDE